MWEWEVLLFTYLAALNPADSPHCCATFLPSWLQGDNWQVIISKQLCQEVEFTAEYTRGIYVCMHVWQGMGMYARLSPEFGILNLDWFVWNSHFTDLKFSFFPGDWAAFTNGVCKVLSRLFRVPKSSLQHWDVHHPKSPWPFWKAHTPEFAVNGIKPPKYCPYFRSQN